MTTGQDLVHLVIILHNNNISSTIMSYIPTHIRVASKVDTDRQASNTEYYYITH